MEQSIPAGKLPQDTASVWSNEISVDTFMSITAGVLPSTTNVVIELSKRPLMGRVTVTTKSAPAPVSETVRGLPDRVSAKLNMPLLAPNVVGVNVTLAVQLEPLARTPQLFVTMYVDALAVTLFTVTVVPELFVYVTVCGPSGTPGKVEKVSVEGDTVIPLDENPEPVMLMLFCVPFEEFAMSVPERLPMAVGVNVTVPVQVPPFAMVAGQLVGVNE